MPSLKPDEPPQNTVYADGIDQSEPFQRNDLPVPESSTQSIGVGTPADLVEAESQFGLSTTVHFKQEPSLSDEEDPLQRSGKAWPRMDGYEIMGLLGRGGMGCVYKARQKSLKRLVALKLILTGEHAGPEEIARFREEAEAIARLKHPNIVQVHEVGEENGYPFLALELVEGGSLATQMRGIPISARQAAQLIETLARAVHAAHQQGIIHRDLKPANILFSPPPFLADSERGATGWVPKITDFGLAKKLDDSADLTATGAILGTPRYMAPEQAWGRSRDIGPTADVYSLGTMLYELLTGRPPFLGTKMEVLDQVRHQVPAAPRSLEPDIPRGLEAICLKCLEKEPVKRYGSAEALAADIRHFLEDKPILACQIGLSGRMLLLLRRKRNALIAVAVAALALGFTWLSAVRWQSYVIQERERQQVDHDRQWKEYHQTRSVELFNKLLDVGPSSWPMPADEMLVLQNGLQDLRIRKNNATARNDNAEIAAVESEVKRAEPLLQRLQQQMAEDHLQSEELPAVTAARTVAGKSKSVNNIKQLNLAMHNYANAMGKLPTHAIYGKDGVPLLSWRVALLPYVNQHSLFNKFKLDEPWNSPANIELLKYMPPCFASPIEVKNQPAYSTFYQVFVGKNQKIGPVFEPGPEYRVNFGSNMPDGSSNTILIVEAATPVIWTKPDDIVIDLNDPLPRLGGLFQDGIHVGLANGSARIIRRNVDESLLKALITRNGDEPIEWAKLK